MNDSDSKRIKKRSRLTDKLTNSGLAKLVSQSEEIEINEVSNFNSTISNFTPFKASSSLTIIDDIIVNIQIKENSNENSNGKLITKRLTLNMSEYGKVSNIISKSVNSFNKIFERDGLSVRLARGEFYYSLKPSKKNGQPNYDLPSKSTT